MNKWVILIFLMSVPQFMEAQNLVFEINNIRNDKGHIQLMFYQNEKQYQEDKPFEIVRYPKTKMKDGRMTVTKELKTGSYAVILLDDEDDDKQMRYNMLGIPREGFGFAGYYHKGMRRPKYKAFEFDAVKKVVMKTIRIRYI